MALDPSNAPARRFVPERDGWWDEYRYEIDPDFPELAAQLAERRSGPAAEIAGPGGDGGT